MQRIVDILAFSDLNNEERHFVESGEVPLRLRELVHSYWLYVLEEDGATRRRLAPPSAGLTHGVEVAISDEGTFHLSLSVIRGQGDPYDVLFEIHDVAPVPRLASS